MGPKRLQFITLSSPKASKKKQTTDGKVHNTCTLAVSSQIKNSLFIQDTESPCGLLFEDAMQEAAVEGDAEELGVELMDTEVGHLSLVLEEAQVKDISSWTGLILVFRVRWSLFYWQQRCPRLK